MARDGLIIAEIPEAKRIARRLARQFQAEENECVSAALLGLVQAERVFDQSRCVPFGAFARSRVRGEVLDHLRMRGMLPKGELARRRADPVYAASREGRFPTLQSRDSTLVLSLLARDDKDMEARLQRHDIETMLAQISPRLAFVVRAYYFEERLAVDIAKQLGVTDARVVQMYREAQVRLRALFMKAGLVLSDLIR